MACRAQRLASENLCAVKGGLRDERLTNKPAICDSNQLQRGRNCKATPATSEAPDAPRKQAKFVGCAGGVLVRQLHGWLVGLWASWRCWRLCLSVCGGLVLVFLTKSYSRTRAHATQRPTNRSRESTGTKQIRSKCDPEERPKPPRSVAENPDFYRFLPIFQEFSDFLGRLHPRRT